MLTALALITGTLMLYASAIGFFEAVALMRASERDDRRK